MKYAIVIPDGAADEPQASLDGKTPLQVASTPAMDALAAAGIVGRAHHVPASMPAGSAVANMSLLGYNPHECFTGRAPLEAAAQGIELAENDWAVRCNLVTIEDQTMRDFTADHISSEEARALLASLAEATDHAGVEWVPGISYRNLMLFRAADAEPPFTAETRTTPPHDLTDHLVLHDHPRGPGSDLLGEIMTESIEIFAEHPVNLARRKAGRRPATNVWLWGQGRRPAMAPFAERYGKSGVMITGVDLLRGLAALIGWERIEVPEATGYTDTDYAAKGQAAVAALQENHIVCVHIEAPDEASHEGDAAAKIQALEEIDRHIVAPLAEALQREGEYRILVTPDHPTFLRTKMHSHASVPFTIAGRGVTPDEQTTYDDASAAASSLSFDEGWQLMTRFLQD